MHFNVMFRIVIVIVIAGALGYFWIINMTMPKVNNPKAVIIITTWRSGSKFLGEILSRHPNTFYSYEPLGKEFQAC